MKILFTILLLFSLGCTPTKSLSNKKETISNNTHSHKKLAKTRGFLNVSITELSRDDDSIYLEAKINPNKDMPDSIAEWKVPEKAKISEGLLDDNVNLIAGRQVSYKLVINKESLQPGDKIFFFAYQMKDGERLGSSINYMYSESSSNKDNKIEAQSLKKIKIQKKKLIQ